jgi:hypothetical protein
MICARTLRLGALLALFAIAWHGAGPTLAQARVGADPLPLELCRSDGLEAAVGTAPGGERAPGAGGGLAHPDHCAPCLAGHAQPAIAPAAANGTPEAAGSCPVRPGSDPCTAFSSAGTFPLGSRAPPHLV